MDYITFLGLAGIVATFYAIYVEKKATATKGKYTFLCDVNDTMTCSKVLTSEYAKLGRVFFGLGKDHPLNLPNTYYGLLFYVAVCLYNFYPFTLIPYREVLFFFAAVGSIVASFVLAYILAFKLHQVCLVCVMTYVINGLILWQAYWQLMDAISSGLILVECV